MKIAAKEAEELDFYITLCNTAPSLPSCPLLLPLIQPVIKVLNKIIATAKS